MVAQAQALATKIQTWTESVWSLSAAQRSLDADIWRAQASRLFTSWERQIAALDPADSGWTDARTAHGAAMTLVIAALNVMDCW